MQEHKEHPHDGAAASALKDPVCGMTVTEQSRHAHVHEGKPVYFYQADKQAGDKTGDNFRDVWHTVKE